MALCKSKKSVIFDYWKSKIKNKKIKEHQQKRKRKKFKPLLQNREGIKLSLPQA